MKKCHIRPTMGTMRRIMEKKLARVLGKTLLGKCV